MIYPVKSAFYFFLVDRFSCARNDKSGYQNLNLSLWSLTIHKNQVMNINSRLKALYKDKMYLCKHERDHVLGYLVVEKRKRARERECILYKSSIILLYFKRNFFIITFLSIFYLCYNLGSERPRYKGLLILFINFILKKMSKSHKKKLVSMYLYISIFINNFNLKLTIFNNFNSFLKLRIL